MQMQRMLLLLTAGVFWRERKARRLDEAAAGWETPFVEMQLRVLQTL
jgi:hypothetical protein